MLSVCRHAFLFTISALLAACSNGTAPVSWGASTAYIQSLGKFETNCRGGDVPAKDRTTFKPDEKIASSAIDVHKDDKLRSASTAALRFAETLVGGEYDKAHALLADDSRAPYTPATLRARYKEFVDHWEYRPNHCMVVMVTLDSDAEFVSEQHAIGYVYVAIDNNENVATEAVSVFVHADGKVSMRDSDWGRP